MIRNLPWAQLLPGASFLLIISLLATGCSSSKGTLTVDANISGGTKFTVYVNSNWTQPTVLPIVPNEWHQYQFPVPAEVSMFRLDPSDLGTATAQIRHAVVELPGLPPRSLVLNDFTKWGHSNSKVTYDSGSKVALIQGEGASGGFYIMGGVNISALPKE